MHTSLPTFVPHCHSHTCHFLHLLVHTILKGSMMKKNLNLLSR
ncbi:hypothetical protein E2C01_066098 [Portunus trituberculatus]|uniref:Uncharacterized protein n=1 Tax=Portunus trituberculatus TaxID=210409 RepID=A0A5B7HSY8_PORTR|nr:hypothetical protein [Portunus trituberculatus]